MEVIRDYPSWDKLNIREPDHFWCSVHIAACVICLLECGLLLPVHSQDNPEHNTCLTWFWELTDDNERTSECICVKLLCVTVHV